MPAPTVIKTHSQSQSLKIIAMVYGHFDISHAVMYVGSYIPKVMVVAKQCPDSYIHSITNVVQLIIHVLYSISHN